MGHLSSEAVGVFRAEFQGKTSLPGDPDYDGLRSVWNGAIDRRPSVIASCTNAEQVAHAVRFARRAGLEIAVPLFVESGDKIEIDTRTHEYRKRV